MAAMRTSLLALLLLPFFLFGKPHLPAAQQGTRPSPARNETATAEISQQARDEVEESVKHLLVSQIEAWNQGQLEGFMQGYWHSPELTFFSGASITKGWEPTLQRYRERYKAQGREMGQLQFQDLNIDVLDRHSAVVTGKFQLTMSNGKTPHGLFTLVVKRLPVGWRIVHDHTCAAE